MTDPTSLPPSIARVLDRFQAMGREEKCSTGELRAAARAAPQALSRPRPRRLHRCPVPDPRGPVPERWDDGRLHFYADLDARQSPTIAAFLAILFGAVNDQPPPSPRHPRRRACTRMMAWIGLHTREVGLNAMVQRSSVTLARPSRWTRRAITAT